MVRADTIKRVPLGFGLSFVCFRPYLAVCGTQLGIKPVPPAVKVQGLNPWTTREVHPFGLGKLFVHRTISPSHETQPWKSSEKQLQFLDPSPCVVGLDSGCPKPSPNRASSEERGCGPSICWIRSIIHHCPFFTKALTLGEDFMNGELSRRKVWYGFFTGGLSMRHPCHQHSLRIFYLV